MATVALCPPLTGDPGMYGLGIRVAFYIQWFGLVIVDYINEAELGDIRLLSLLSSAAATLALVIQLSMSELQPAEIYIVLLLASGIYIFLVPLYIWRAVTCFNPYWDPYKWSKETPTPIYKICNFLLLLTLASLQVWFWCSYLPSERFTCDQWGFFFAQVPIANRVYISFNAILWLLVIIVCTIILLVKSGWEVKAWKDRQRRRRRVSKVHAVALQELRAFSNLAVASVLTAAIELVVSWNGIESVNSFTETAQTLPLIVSAGIVVRVIFFHFARTEGDSDSSSDSHSSVSVEIRSTHYTPSHPSRRSRGSGSGWPPPPPPVAQR